MHMQQISFELDPAAQIQLSSTGPIPASGGKPKDDTPALLFQRWDVPSFLQNSQPSNT